MKNGKGQKAKEEAKETVLGFLKLDISAFNRPAERPPVVLFLGSENGAFNRVMSLSIVSQ